MTKRNHLSGFDVPEDRIQQELLAIFGPSAENWYSVNGPDCRENQVVVGRVLRVCGEGVWVDIGAKSPGIIPLREWHAAQTGPNVPPHPGDTVTVMLVSVDDATGTIVLSRREAIRAQQWTQVTTRYREGERVQGTVIRVIRGGLLVDIGCAAFLPTSLIDVRRPTNLHDYVGKPLECTILRIDPVRRCILLSRRRQVVNEDPMLDRSLLANFEEGQIRIGVVKNIADFGAFVDLGGIDGLLHVREMFWGPASDPRRVVTLNQRIEVVILQVNRSSMKISLSLKHKAVNPDWLTPTVRNVARGIVEESCREWLPILADALEDAGCDALDLLSRLRDPDSHDSAGPVLGLLLASRDESSRDVSPCT